MSETRYTVEIRNPQHGGRWSRWTKATMAQAVDTIKTEMDEEGFEMRLIPPDTGGGVGEPLYWSAQAAWFIEGGTR